MARVHEEGRDVQVEYSAEGATIRAVVGAQLAAELNGVAAESSADVASEVGQE